MDRKAGGPVPYVKDTPVRRPSLLSRVVRRAILGIYRLQGWELTGRLPDVPKMLIAGAPHSSNWDFVFFIGATHEAGVKPGFMGKRALFEGAMRDFMYDMGGVPVDRSGKANVTQQVAAEFARRDHLALVMAAEGSRKSDGTWRSGFYHIARAAGVPIVPTYVDLANRRLGFGPPIEPTGTYGETLTRIAQFMRANVPDYPRYKVLETQAERVLAEEGYGARDDLPIPAAKA